MKLRTLNTVEPNTNFKRLKTAEIQQKPLNVITVTLSAAYWDQISEVSMTEHYLIKSIGSCYHSVIVIKNRRFLSDHIKRLGLDLKRELILGKHCFLRTR